MEAADEVFISSTEIENELPMASSWVVITIIKGVFTVTQMEELLKSKFRNLTPRNWDWDVKRFNDDFIANFPHNFLCRGTVGSIVSNSSILGLKRWSPQEGSKLTGARESVWITLKNLPLVYRNLRMVRLVLAKVGEVKRLQSDYLDVADYTTLRVELEVSTPCELPSLIMLFTNEYYHEVSLKRYTGDPNFRMNSTDFKNVVFVKGIDGKLKTWRYKRNLSVLGDGVFADSEDANEGEIGNPITISSTNVNEDEAANSSEMESNENMVDVGLGCFKAYEELTTDAHKVQNRESGEDLQQEKGKQRTQLEAGQMESSESSQMVSKTKKKNIVEHAGATLLTSARGLESDHPLEGVDKWKHIDLAEDSIGARHRARGTSSN